MRYFKIDNFYFDSQMSYIIENDKFHDYMNLHNNDVKIHNIPSFEHKFHPISEIGICLTYNCNFRCNYCIDSSSSGNKRKIKLDDVEAYLIECIKCFKIFCHIRNEKNPLAIYFTGGGEQTIDWDFFVNTIQSVQKLCKKYNVDYELGLTTNGYLNQKKCDFILNNFDYVTISFDGIPLLQNKNRRLYTAEATSDTVENAIHSFLTKGKKLTIRTTVNPKSWTTTGGVFK